jgi:hypothetical protein
MAASARVDAVLNARFCADAWLIISAAAIIAKCFLGFIVLILFYFS